MPHKAQTDRSFIGQVIVNCAYAGNIRIANRPDAARVSIPIKPYRLWIVAAALSTERLDPTTIDTALTSMAASPHAQLHFR